MKSFKDVAVDDRFREIDNRPSDTRAFQRYCGCTIHVSKDAAEPLSIESIDGVVECQDHRRMRADAAAKVRDLCRDDPAYRAWYLSKSSEPFRRNPDA